MKTLLCGKTLMMIVSLSRRHMIYSLRVTGELRRAKDRHVLEATRANKLDFTPNTKQNKESKFPVMVHYNIDPEQEWIIQALIKEFQLANKNAYGTSTLRSNLGNNQQSFFIKIPKSQSLHSLKRNESQQNWLRELFLGLASYDGDTTGATDDNENDDTLELEEESCSILLEYIATHKRYRDCFNQTIDRLGVSVLPALDRETTFFVQSSAGLSYNQMRVLRHCLKTFTGAYIFSPETHVRRLAGYETIPMEGGTLTYKRERIEWMAQPVDEMLFAYMRTLYRSNQKQRINHIDISVHIDHGQGFSRATLQIVCRWKDPADGNGETQQSETFALASARCRKDNIEILQGTYAKTINESLTRIQANIQEGRRIVVYDSKLLAEAAPTTDHPPNEGGSGSTGHKIVVKWENPVEQQQSSVAMQMELLAATTVECWMSGDLLFFAMGSGKEGSSSHWCTYCQLSHAEWQSPHHTAGALWSLEKLTTHFNDLQHRARTIEQLSKLPAKERKGVSSLPLFDAVDIDHYVVPVLHLTLGLGNTIYKKLLEECQAARETFTDEYVKKEAQCIIRKNDLNEARDKLRDFEVHNGENEREIRKRLRRKQRERGGRGQQGGAGVVGGTGGVLGAEDDRDNATSCTVDETELHQLQRTRERLKKDVDLAKAAKAAVQSEFDTEAKKEENCRTVGQPVHAAIEQICYNHGIEFGVYHGGDLQGNACRRLMQRAPLIVDDITKYLLDESQHPHQNTEEDDTAIKEVLGKYARLLGHADAVLSCLRTPRYRVNQQTVSTARDHVKHLLALWRHLGLSVTPKLHCIEGHAVHFLEMHNGFCDLAEDAGERAHHQEGIAELRVSAVKGVIRKNQALALYSWMKKLPDVKAKQEIVNASKKRKFKNLVPINSSEVSEQEKKRIRDAERLQLLSLDVPSYPATTLTTRKRTKVVESRSTYSL